MQGMNFGMDGPQVTGWWVNPKTGDKFNAIDTFFEDNNLLIKTSDGRLLNYNQIQNYIQTDSPDSFKKPEPQKKEEEIPAEILNELQSDDDLMIPDDDIYGGSRLAPSAELGNIRRESEPAKPPIRDYDIIDRALALKSSPSPVAKIEWNDFPEREIEMLIDVMGISEVDIIMYYINKISMKEVQAMVAAGIEQYITSTLHGNSLKEVESRVVKHDETTQPEQPEHKKKTKKK